MSMSGRRWVAVAVALVLFGGVVFAATNQYQGRTVVLADVRGRADLAAVHSVRVVSARVTSDGRQLVVRYVGGVDGCGQFSSLRVTRQRALLRVRVQTGNEPVPAACSLVGNEETRTVSLRHRVDPSIRVTQQT